MNFCKIEKGIVVQRAVFDDGLPETWPDRDKWIHSEEAQIGWRYNKGKFSPPAPVAPANPLPVGRDLAAELDALTDVLVDKGAIDRKELKTAMRR